MGTSTISWRSSRLASRARSTRSSAMPRIWPEPWSGSCASRRSPCGSGEDTQSAEEGHRVLVKLSDGEDVFPALEAAARKHRIESGAVLWGIGMLQDFEIGFFGPEGYEKTSFSGRHELIAFHGSIAMKAEPRFHIHVA